MISLHFYYPLFFIYKQILYKIKVAFVYYRKPQPSIIGYKYIYIKIVCAVCLVKIAKTLKEK